MIECIGHNFWFLKTVLKMHKCVNSSIKCVSEIDT